MRYLAETATHLSDITIDYFPGRKKSMRRNHNASFRVKESRGQDQLLCLYS